MTNILKMVFDAKKKKYKDLDISKKRLLRRGLKLSEECGEVCEAIFGITDEENYKGKTYDDVREELVDVIIVALDALFSEFEDEELPNNFDDIIKLRSVIFEEKITKWLKDKK